MLCAKDGRNIKCYDGATWRALGEPPGSADVRQIVVWNEMVCAVCQDDAVYGYKDGSWINYGKYGSYMYSYASTTWNGKLCVGTANEASGLLVTCLSESGWSNLNYPGSAIRAMTSWNGKLFVSDSSGDVECYDGSSWQNIGNLGGEGVNQLAVWNGNLTARDPNNSIRCYDGSSWQTLGTFGETISSVAVWNGKLCVSDAAGSVSCYDGIGWEVIGNLDSSASRLTAWNGKLCAGDGNKRVKCYFDSDALDNYWYKQGNDLRYDYDAYVGSLISHGRVGVGTDSPAAELDVAGTAKATTYEYRSAQTRYYSIAPSDFIPATPDTADVLYRYDEVIVQGASSVQFFAPVHLPHGATIKEVCLWFSDGSLKWDFQQVDHSSGTTVILNDVSLGCHSVAWSVDNINYSYHIWTWGHESGDAIYGARVKYEVGTPLP